MANRTYNLTRADIPNAYVTTGYITNAIIDNLTVDVSTKLKEVSSDPSAVIDYGLLYVKDDGNIYFRNDGGDIYQLNISGDYSPNDYFSIGGELPGPYPTLRRCTIDSTGDIELIVGSDLMLNSDFDSSPDQQFIAEKIWNSVWNDVADFQELALHEESMPGKCYYDTVNGAKLCNIRCQKSVIGICSDTFGFGVGVGRKLHIPIAIAGWTLAYVDKEYESGTPLTNDENGNLTEMTREEVQMYPERIVAIYKRKEKTNLWGTPGKEIDVNERHWVKVK